MLEKEKATKLVAFLFVSYRTRDRKQSVALLKQAGETLHLRNFFSLRSLWPLCHLKLDFLTLFESLEAVALDSAIVNEDIRRAGLLNKAVALRIVKPLDLTGYSRHNNESS